GNQFVVYEKQSGPVGGAIWAMTLSGDRKQVELVKPDTPQGSIGSHRISSDGHWLAYTARDSGREDVYVTTFPGGKSRWQVSTEAGTFPVWRGDGKEIYFVGLDGILRAVQVKAQGENLDIGPSQNLFAIHTGNQNPLFAPFDATADGQRFLVLQVSAIATEPPM